MEGAQISFSAGTMLGYFISGAVYALLPITAFLLLKRAGTARLWPAIVGAVVYFLTTRLSDFFAYIFGACQDHAVKAAISAELVCIFEELGRCLAMRYPVTNIKAMNSAVCYGIGHGGLECLIRGAAAFRVMGYGSRLSSRGSDSFTAGKSPEKAAQITERLAELADHPLYLSLISSVHSISTFGVHIALSLLIFVKVRETGQLRWLMAAIGLHYFMNGTAWALSFAGAPLLSEIMGIACGGAVIALVCRIIRIRGRFDQIIYPELFGD
ncbi:MAG: YhfC family intramembrane metalloprotease [Ruminococcus sp.]|nr:YhfC family intramembrane metalloprotease [Ruminococcus sp.]